MQKIPTIFFRESFDGRMCVVDVPHPYCQWVFDGEGTATRKLDGTCCAIRGGILYRRREIAEGKAPPAGFIATSVDDQTGKTTGWVLVGDGREDRYHREAFSHQKYWEDGTYELIGPNIQGNPEHVKENMLVAHGAEGLAGPYGLPPRTFDGLKTWFAEHNVEGIVWHHPDGRMAKIKRRDFGLNREGTTK